jgi:bZIP transcription factor
MLGDRGYSDRSGSLQDGHGAPGLSSVLSATLTASFVTYVLKNMVVVQFGPLPGLPVRLASPTCLRLGGLTCAASTSSESSDRRTSVCQHQLHASSAQRCPSFRPKVVRRGVADTCARHRGDVHRGAYRTRPLVLHLDRTVCIAGRDSVPRPRRTNAGVRVRERRMRAAAQPALSDSGASSIDANAALAGDPNGRLTDEELEGLDPAERKLAKQRAKNRRTAAASRERKKAYVQKLEHENAELEAEMDALNVMLTAKEQQLAELRTSAGGAVHQVGAATGNFPSSAAMALGKQNVQDDPELKNQLLLLAIYAKSMASSPERDTLVNFLDLFEL